MERRGSGGQQKVLRRTAICVLTIESRQGQNTNLAADRTSQPLPSKRNVYGELYGFVRYSNVKDVSY